MAKSALSPEVRAELRQMAKRHRDLDAFTALRNRQIIVAGELAEAAPKAAEIAHVDLSWRDAELLRLVDFPEWTCIRISNYRLSRGPAWEKWQSEPPAVRWKRSRRLSAYSAGVDVCFASFMPWLRKFVLPEIKVEAKSNDGRPFEAGWDVSLYGFKIELQRYFTDGGRAWHQGYYRPNADSSPMFSANILDVDVATHWCRLVLWDLYWDRVKRGLPVLSLALHGDEEMVMATC